MDRMILVELEDVRHIHSQNPFNPNGPTEYRLTPGERPPWVDDPDFFETDKRFYPGPYLLRVTEEGAWLSRDGEWWEQAVQCEMYPSVERRMWSEYAELFAGAIGISVKSLSSRFYWMWRELNKTPNEWVSWEKLYHWPEGSDAMWDSLHQQPLYELREEERKEIRYVQR